MAAIFSEVQIGPFFGMWWSNWWFNCVFFLLSKIHAGPICFFLGGGGGGNSASPWSSPETKFRWAALDFAGIITFGWFSFCCSHSINDGRYDFALSPEKINKLLKFNSLPLKSDLSKRKGKRLPTIIFQENLLLNFGGVVCRIYCLICLYSPFTLAKTIMFTLQPFIFGSVIQIHFCNACSRNQAMGHRTYETTSRLLAQQRMAILQEELGILTENCALLKCGLFC